MYQKDRVSPSRGLDQVYTGKTRADWCTGRSWSFPRRVDTSRCHKPVTRVTVPGRLTWGHRREVLSK